DERFEHGSALPGTDERGRVTAAGGERRLPRLAHARRAEAERGLVERVTLALAVAAHVHDVQVAQDAELVRRGAERGAERAGQLAHAQLAERERVHHLAAGRVPEGAEHARQALDVGVVIERAADALRGRARGGRGGRARAPDPRGAAPAAAMGGHGPSGWT